MSSGKEAAGRAAAELVTDGMRLGLGTGSTVAYFLEALAERGVDVAGVPTSQRTADRCRELGIELLEPGGATGLDLCVDGADELTPDLALTKGGGGALLREKVVARMSARMVVIATPDKVVERLGDTFALPLEVVPFAVAPVARWCQELGLSVRPRDEGRYRTDNGNAILDVRRDGGFDDPVRLGSELGALPGVCEHGLFLGLASGALLGRDDGTVEQLGSLT